MDKHISGSWSCVPSIPEEGVECFWIENGAQRIAAVDGPQNEEREATARLIAAAPELLAVAEMALSYIEAVCFNTPNEKKRRNYADAASQIRAALSKARGEQV